MNKVYKIVIAVMFVGLAIAYGATYKLNRLTESGICTQGADSSTQHTLVVSDNPTNEFIASIQTATVALTATSSTNAFSPVYTSVPIGLLALKSGSLPSTLTNVIVTLTTSNMVVSGLSTNLATGLNNLPVFIYGTQRTGSQP